MQKKQKCSELLSGEGGLELSTTKKSWDAGVGMRRVIQFNNRKPTKNKRGKGKPEKSRCCLSQMPFLHLSFNSLWVELCPKRYVRLLTLSICEYDLILKQSLCRHNQINSMTSVLIRKMEI